MKPISSTRRGRIDGRLAAAVVLPVLAFPAFAETNVEIYGIIDAGLLYQSRTDPDGKSKTSMETSGLRQSILGFKGDRDLGRGLEGFFNLEIHYDNSTMAAFMAQATRKAPAPRSSGVRPTRPEGRLGQRDPGPPIWPGAARPYRHRTPRLQGAISPTFMPGPIINTRPPL